MAEADYNDHLENMERSAQTQTERRLLNPAASEFFPQNPSFIFPIITTTTDYHNHYFQTFLHPPPPPPPPPPPQPFQMSAPAVEARDHHHQHHNRTAVVVTDHQSRHDHRHDQDDDQSRARNINNYWPPRSSVFGRRGSSAFFGRSRNMNNNNNISMQRRVLREKLGARNYEVKQQHCSSSEVLPAPNLMHGSANDTTVMIRNIPSKYTRRMLLDFLDNHCMLQNQRVVNNNAAGENDQHPIISAFDFLYLPMDFRTELNKGYAFVNFTSPEAASTFSEATNGQTWDHFHSSKITRIARAKFQGKDKIVRYFESVAFPCEKEEFLPVWFSPPRDGTNKESVTQTTVGKLIGIRS
ncbi:hypothetical protein L484_008436 [Morus notabilis]|uniref:RRM domain-containing protein n=1 Tax=Morus notabilis TaxID=981085 RepID=W9SDT6_9ROSA|nr:meiosis protein mei2 [Morus notabilis]EXC24665.1 hypothetical protein L484_008436 [Morus notabilis]